MCHKMPIGWPIWQPSPICEGYFLGLTDWEWPFFLPGSRLARFHTTGSKTCTCLDTQQVDQLCRQRLKPSLEVHRRWENVEDDGLYEDVGHCPGVSENLPGRVYTWQSCNFTTWWAETLLPTMHKFALLPWTCDDCLKKMSQDLPVEQELSLKWGPC